MMKRAVFFFSITIIFYSCTIRDKKPEAPLTVPGAYAASYDMIKQGAQLVKEGDLIVRSGQEFTSQFIKQFNRTDKNWSHSGIIFFENNYPYVYHIVPGDENPDQKLRRDSLVRFCNPRKNFGFAIYRYDMNEDEIKKFRLAIEDWKERGVSFDSTFNLETNDKMYCSEMIKKGLTKATGNRIVIGTTPFTKNEAKFFSTHLRIPLEYTSKLKVVAIENLFLNPYCHLIKKFDFNSTP